MSLRSLALGLIATTALAGAAVVETRSISPALQFRTGWDDNPTGTGEAAGRDETLFVAGSVSVGVSSGSAKFSYAADVIRYVDAATEDYATHRLGAAFQKANGAWAFSADASSLFVDGRRDTLLSIASCNANAISLWRERRAQWQHRVKVQSQYTEGPWVVRSTASLLSYDYQTRAVAGYVAFADRSDVNAALDLGWKRAVDSCWFTGARVGHQDQAQVPLPNCAFDYANNYTRVAVGWEGKPLPETTVALVGGPDFRRYTGAIDPQAFVGGRDRTSLWFEGTFTTKLPNRFTWSGKAVRMNWLSSTGKSAYIDTCAETALTWSNSTRTAVRFLAKIHRCDYFPAVRDDWEAFAGPGVSLTLSSRTVVTADVMRQRGWNRLENVSGREFSRTLLTIGAVIQLR